MSNVIFDSAWIEHPHRLKQIFEERLDNHTGLRWGLSKFERDLDANSYTLIYRYDLFTLTAVVYYPYTYRKAVLESGERVDGCSFHLFFTCWESEPFGDWFSRTSHFQDDPVPPQDLVSELDDAFPVLWKRLIQNIQFKLDKELTTIENVWSCAKKIIGT